MTTFYTIEKPTEGFFKDRGSRFLSFAFSVNSLSDVKERLQELRKQYHDARHHCYGYSVGMKSPQIRANDDGEPAHSAGDPILGQIRSHGLTNTLIVVVRYFGGTKLGVAGLINAYKTAAAEALEASEKKEIFPQTLFLLKYAYDQTNEAERLLASQQLRVIERKFESECEVLATIHEELFPLLLAQTEAPSQLSIKILSESEDPLD